MKKGLIILSILALAATLAVRSGLARDDHDDRLNLLMTECIKEAIVSTVAVSRDTSIRDTLSFSTCPSGVGLCADYTGDTSDATWAAIKTAICDCQRSVTGRAQPYSVTGMDMKMGRRHEANQACPAKALKLVDERIAKQFRDSLKSNNVLRTYCNNTPCFHLYNGKLTFIAAVKDEAQRKQLENAAKKMGATTIFFQTPPKK
ncbi:MAG: hypothetical protein ABI977_07870 [Acidobacteriota bacterium]